MNINATSNALAADLRMQTLTAAPAASRNSPPGVSDTPVAAAPVMADAVAQAGAAASAEPAPLAQVQQAIEDVRSAIAPVAQDLNFSIDEDTGKTVVKVVDTSTDEVIRQIPSEEIISIAKALDKLQGLLVQQKA